MTGERVLYFGRDEAEAARCARALRHAGFLPLRALHVAEALTVCRLGQVAVAVYDVAGGERGVLERVKQLSSCGATVVVVADEGRGRRARQLGAWGYVLRRDRQYTVDLVAMISRALEFRRLQVECDAARRAVATLAQRGEPPADTLLTDKVVAAIAHEINNPIAVLLGYSQMLGELDAPDAQVAEIAARLEANARAVLDLTGDLLDALRAQTGSLDLLRSAADFNQLVEQAALQAGTVAQRLGRQVVFQPAGLLPTITADQHRLGRLLDGLFAVVLAATPAGGVVRASTAVDGARVSLRLGVAATPVAEVFAGRGKLELGATGVARLALARAVVGGHGGDLVVHDPPALGLTVRLPVVAGRLAAAQ
ncbi:MAG: HAMP domain-containing histidine kinase [Deltaproteobacteria bacterium]|nr:HAMP domain-containing histidine kinase [Deltaproteobacteria bacterium]